eukprot:COSAG01_NODE_16_length_40091_cov_15.728646_34_plen_73_part_00
MLRLVDRLHAASADGHGHHAASFEVLQREFGSVAAAIAGLFERLTQITQRELCYAIYPYQLRAVMIMIGTRD